MYNDCLMLQKAAGDGGWALDFHTQFDPPDAIRLCTMIEAADLNPYFIEDLIRSENIDAYETIRARTKVPIAIRLLAPAPLARASGSTPKMNAQLVIRIGRRRIRAASRAAS